MKVELSESANSNILKIIDIILDQIELGNTESVSGIYPVPILSKKFDFLVDPYDLGKILDKINEGEKSRVLRAISKDDYVSHSHSINGETNHITKQSIAELQRMKDISNHDYIEFKQDGYVYFLIENIERLKEVKSELCVKNISITYNIKIGQFIFNKKDKVMVTGKQRDTADALVNAGKDVMVSWDAINDKITGSMGEILNENETKLAKKSINEAVSNINEKTEKYLDPEELLIGFKEREYWLQYEVGKVG